MKNKFAKVRSIAGLFLEALMIVFIFAYSNGDFVTSNDSSSEEGKPLKGVVLSYTMALTSLPATQTFYILPKNQIPEPLTFSLPIDVHGICVALSDALSVNQFERNTFYIASADNIP
jgi:hypothetical protein